MMEYTVKLYKIKSENEFINNICIIMIFYDCATVYELPKRYEMVTFPLSGILYENF
jgi:hypothetical protein